MLTPRIIILIASIILKMRHIQHSITLYCGYLITKSCTKYNILVSYGIKRHYDNFLDDTSYGISLQILSWMMEEFIHWPKPYLFLSTTCEGILPWMIEIWMENLLAIDSNCNIVNLQSPEKFTRNDK